MISCSLSGVFCEREHESTPEEQYVEIHDDGDV